MSEKTAYIAGALNIAFFRGDDDRLYLLQNGAESVPQPADGYRWSQLRAAPAEYTETTFTSTEELKQVIRREAARQDALDMALELMDTRFSATYREGIAPLLAEALERHAGLIQFIENRLLTSPLPDAFNPELAMKMLDSFAPVAANVFYNALSEKTELFAAFYTLFITSLSAEKKDEQSIRKLLTDNGLFSDITKALYNGSAGDYRVTAIRIVATLKINDIDAQAIDFMSIARQLESNYKIQLTEKTENAKIEILMPHRLDNTHGILKKQWAWVPSVQTRDNIAFEHGVFLSTMYSALTARDSYKEESVFFSNFYTGSYENLVPIAVVNWITFPLHSEAVYITGRIKQIFPEAKILSYFNSHPEVGHIVQMISAGATGFLCEKDISTTSLKNALSAIQKDEFYFSTDIKNAIIVGAAGATPPEKILSATEIKLLELYSHGYTSKEIADRLNISFARVKKSRLSVFNKLKAFLSSFAQPVAEYMAAQKSAHRILKIPKKGQRPF